MFSFYGENFIFLELRGTPVVIKTVEFQAGRTLGGFICTMQFIPTQPEIPRVPVGRPLVRSVGFIYLIFICPVDFGNINIHLP